MIERHLARSGVACIAACLALFAWLHVTPPSSLVDWRTRTLSQYALLSNGWAFDVATLLLAAGSAAVLAALVRARVLRAGSGAGVALGLWVIGLVGVVVFEKHNWSVGPSVSGDVHRAASLLAFLSLPVSALLAGASGLRRPPVRAAAITVLLAGVAALLCFSPILWALLSEPWTGVRWWRAIPLGAVERLLGLAEVATVLLLARWATLAPAAAGQPEVAARA
ncbi:DUF998 domain-containing protein [Actinoplanes aureus]|uniref:DUF998 domain-containing protein n=1 Tax=Actinoplanes aureus TaxID=2792083 RepID=A0A931CEF5_9ACTN|nr:DUF998 domain-containing protein [Actinoplanes aureus]MBG0564678.1 DUF998 domain-containing protein [Actinoplanes aureus]